MFLKPTHSKKQVPGKAERIANFFIHFVPVAALTFALSKLIIINWLAFHTYSQFL